ncbi:hypothetical protein RN001_006890 [Aquatica leii]|uniref:Sphingomyelin phosphodiesterase n=1 Tax=Aquatica leii TaxID=1421715 RepID=A0AAN7PJ71_9COLE|nr:hypothetical protein RN001_006890 [Aquatica leii]
MKWFFRSVLIFLLVANAKSDWAKKLEEEIATYIKTGDSGSLKDVIDKVFEAKKEDFTENNAYCISCKVVANAAVDLRKSGADNNVFGNFLKNMCKIFSFSGEKTCSGLIDISLNSWLHILDNKKITGERICSIRLQHKNCQDPSYTPWHINIPEGKTKLLPKTKVGKLKKILQLSDVHYDAFYKPGSNANCGESLCCESDSGEPKSDDEAAGYWGDYHECDIPWHTIENALTEMKQRHPDVDRVYFTGDIVSHQTWATSVEKNSNIVKTFLKKLKEAFGNTPVYPILGNHEPHPVDLFPPLDVKDELSMQWLYDLIADEWTQWLPKETKDSIRKGGYYTVLVKPGFRIIAINSNVCFTNNAWLAYDDRDPLNQLQWLADALFEAEKNDEAVHILSHVPPGDDECIKQWAHEYRRIIERFHGIITEQFNGHTHMDELKIFYDPNDDDRVIHVANNGGSLTTFVSVNPNYKIYYIEEGQNRVLDYDTWTYDLPEANKNNSKPNWFKLYSFKDAYEMDNLDGDSFHKLLKKMANNPSLLEKYESFRTRNSSKLVQAHYDKEYLDKVLCSITSVEYTYPKECKVFKNT